VLGSWGPQAARLARGEDAREVEPWREPNSRARGVTLKLQRARPLGGGRYPLVTRAASLSAATDDGAELAGAACELLRRAGLAEPVRLIGIAATRLEAPGPEQLELFRGAAGAERRARLNRVLDGIRERFGEAALQRASAAAVDRAGLSAQIKRGAGP
jgi:hypothetical protein